MHLANAEIARKMIQVDRKCALVRAQPAFTSEGIVKLTDTYKSLGLQLNFQDSLYYSSKGI